MTDTPRTLAELLALFADTGAEPIDPQDVRDFAVSVMGEGGPSPGIRPLKNTINEMVSYSGVQTKELLNVSGAGTVESLWIALWSTGSTPFPSIHTSVFDFYFNGESSPSISIKVDDLFLNRVQAAPNFWHLYFGKTYQEFVGAVSNFIGGYFRLPMPYQNGCIINWRNTDAGDSGYLWSAVDYHEGATILPLRRKKLCVEYHDAVTVAYGTWQDVLNITSKKGELAGIQFFVTSTVSHEFMEGNFEFYRDGEGTPSFKSPGTEDFFLGAFLFGGTVANYDVLPKTLGRDSGLIHKGTISGGSFISPFTIATYRWFLNELYPFDTGLHIRWQNGASAGNATLSCLVWYYVDTP